MKLALFSYKISTKAAKKLIQMTGKPANKTMVSFITTAANPHIPKNPIWLRETEKQLKQIGFNVERFDLEKAYKEKIDLDGYFANKDVIFVSGGNTFYLLYWMRKTGFDVLLKKLIDKNIIYAGASAGVVCLFDKIDPISLIDEPDEAPDVINKGLSILDFVVIPHWGTREIQDKLEETKLFYEKEGLKVYTISDHEALFLENKNVTLV